ncbi:Polyketide cyclase/dehydrase and lipid transport superfamily protein [Perilla frutescens var. hirtella]|nr:Polyketide cyclase/dehydrase and lipid transport superfamily protein [Perilla frutescens var. hirtella]KAH6815412.1 Polyketide cyclase/dehydrase and lipid transport superfamily protein [Perilla frutescens var. frutescens]
MAVAQAFLEILKKPGSWAMIIGVIQFLGPVWIGFLLGVMVGWAWKPRWATLGNCKFDFSAPSSPSTLFKGFGSAQSLDSCKEGTAISRLEQKVKPAIDNAICSPSELGKEDLPLIINEDLEHLCHLVERKDGGPPWKHMMDRSAQNMSYQAWQRDPQSGPPQYCSRTVYENATPELLRDFFWDDDFRLKWDDMLTHASILEECPTTGSMVVHWIRKFPFFCSDREYIIGRRIWESGRSYYCVTKGVPSLSIPRKDKPRRVDLFYSSWFIQAVESRKGNGDLSACEVILFHYEDMGIPWEIAKFGVRQGMWGAVKNIERGFRAYQKHRASGAPLSRHAFMAQINTKLDPDYLKTLEEDEVSPVTPLITSDDEKPKGMKIPKLLIIGGAIVVACTLDRGLLTKTLIFGVARKFGNIKGGGPYPRSS